MSSQTYDFDTLWNYEDPAGTEQKFRTLLADGQRELPQRLELLTQIVRAMGLQRRFDEAQSLLDEVSSQMTDQMPRVMVRCLLERGRLFNTAGKPIFACPLFRRAFEIATAHQLDFHSIDAAHMLGIAEASTQSRLEWNEKALTIAEQTADPRAMGWRGPIFNNMGWELFEQKQFERALELFNRGVVLRIAAKQPRELRIAQYAVAKALRAMGRLEEAMPMIQSVCDESAAAGDQDGYFEEELAECLLARGDAKSAQPHFKRAFELLSRDDEFTKSHPDRINRLKSLAK
jgi:tetratricopeptide (TPR) repeat protein